MQKQTVSVVIPCRNEEDFILPCLDSVFNSDCPKEFLEVLVCDGMSDDIPASIGDSQPARLADGEFVIPADVVSHLGNGSTDAGAKRLYAMMDKVRQARTGRKKQAPQVNFKQGVPV